MTNMGTKNLNKYLKASRTVKEKMLSKELLSFKKKTAWSWERMCYEFHRVMAHEGPSHTTLFGGVDDERA